MWRIAVLTLFIFALSAPVALAAGGHDGGEGLWGQTDDKVVTYAGFILIVGFPILILVLTLIQSALDRRKDRRLAAAKARKQRADLRGGW
jgi:membrane protease YdiL (CAAX protease family)